MLNVNLENFNKLNSNSLSLSDWSNCRSNNICSVNTKLAVESRPIVVLVCRIIGLVIRSSALSLITSTLSTHSWSQEREGEIQQTCSMSTITYNQISKEEPTISTKTYHVRFIIHPLSLPLVGRTNLMSWIWHWTWACILILPVRNTIPLGR